MAGRLAAALLCCIHCADLSCPDPTPALPCSLLCPDALLCPPPQEFLRELKFGIGDGHLHYYLYNWRVAKPLVPSEVGLILM